MRRLHLLTALVLAGPLLSPALRAQAADSTAPAPAAATHADTAAAAMRLRPGDVVRLRVWREADISGDYPVDERGVVVFPMLGPRPVVDLSPETLRRQLVEDYQKYLRNPSIDVTLLRRVSVLGAVKQPGLYPVDPTMTVADALALAGGALPEGAGDHLELIRNGRQVDVKIDEATRIAELSLQSGDQIFVPERGWLARNQGVVPALITSGVSLLVTLLLLRHR